MTRTHTAETLAALDDAAFNRVIAELAGGRVIEFHEAWDGHFGGVYGTRHTWYAYVAPGESRPRHRALRALTPSRAWWNALHYGGEKWASLRIPSFATDLNAAWGLGLLGHWHRIVGDNEYGDPYAKITPCDTWIHADFEAEHASPARALSTAWALWKLAKEVGT